MYRELLSECIQGNQQAKLQDSCAEQDIKDAERTVGYVFPDELKALLYETNGDHCLLLSIEEIVDNVAFNRRILAEAFDDFEEYLRKIDRYIFFVTNGCGDYYCYRVLSDGEVDTTAIYLIYGSTKHLYAVLSQQISRI